MLVHSLTYNLLTDGQSSARKTRGLTYRLTKLHKHGHRRTNLAESALLVVRAYVAGMRQSVASRIQQMQDLFDHGITALVCARAGGKKQNPDRQHGAGNSPPANRHGFPS